MKLVPRQAAGGRRQAAGGRRQAAGGRQGAWGPGCASSAGDGLAAGLRALVCHRQLYLVAHLSSPALD